MYAKLIENWLTNVNERGYQIPFCEVLLTKGFKVLYVSSHGPGEHGKDVIARDSVGTLWAFQLKGGRIRLAEWRRMRDEVRELVELPINYPGVAKTERFRPVLVTNGDVSPDARDNILGYAEKWAAAGSETLEVWSGHHVLAMFVEAHGSYLPVQVEAFRQFAELYSLDPGDRIPRDRLSHLLTQLVRRDRVGRTAKQKKRALESMVLIGSYLVGQYESVANHVSAAEGWTCLAATVLHLVDRDKITRKNYGPSLELVRRAYESNLLQLQDEALAASNFVQGAVILAEPEVLPARVTLILSWLAAFALEQAHYNSESPDNQIRDLLSRERANFRSFGEADFPRVVAVICLAEACGLHESARALLLGWIVAIVQANTGAEPDGVPSPYWDHEKVIRLRHGMLPNYEREAFERTSYTLLTALDMAVRRGWRDEIATVWPLASKITMNDFVPDDPYWCTWRAEKGNLNTFHFPQPMSWGRWQAQQADLRTNLPRSLQQHAEWVLPIALTFPHRTNRSLTAFIDNRFERTRADAEVMVTAESRDRSTHSAVSDV